MVRPFYEPDEKADVFSIALENSRPVTNFGNCEATIFDLRHGVIVCFLIAVKHTFEVLLNIIVAKR